jgi:hypothetical protein
VSIAVLSRIVSERQRPWHAVRPLSTVLSFRRRPISAERSRRPGQNALPRPSPLTPGAIHHIDTGCGARTNAAVLPVYLVHRRSPASSARARCSTAASTPRNLTSGRRSRRLHQNSPCPKVSGPEGRDQSLWRHLAARTLHGPPAGIGRIQSPRRWLKLVVSRAGSGRLQHGALRHLPVPHVAPERDQQTAGKGDDRNPAHPPALLTHARTELAAQRAVGLVPHPQPS